MVGRRRPLGRGYNGSLNGPTRDGWECVEAGRLPHRHCARLTRCPPPPCRTSRPPGVVQVYDEVAGLVTSVLDGYNVAIMAYGQTGSGKTFTMEGPEVGAALPPSCVGWGLLRLPVPLVVLMVGIGYRVPLLGGYFSIEEAWPLMVLARCCHPLLKYSVHPAWPRRATPASTCVPWATCSASRGSAHPSSPTPSQPGVQATCQ